MLGKEVPEISVPVEIWQLVPSGCSQRYSLCRNLKGAPSCGFRFLGFAVSVLVLPFGERRQWGVYSAVRGYEVLYSSVQIITLSVAGKTSGEKSCHV